VNITRDSFSDGGLFLNPKDAIHHGRELMAAGAHGLDLGAESTHPDSEDVDSAEELRRLVPVIRQLSDDGIPLSVDTWKAEVMAEVLPLGVRWINDVHGFRDPRSIAAVRGSSAELIVMHSRSSSHRAARGAPTTERTALESVRDFFRNRPQELQSAGIDPGRLILDPGMGFFLGPGPEDSISVLGALPELRSYGHRVLISVSRKSFIGKMIGKPTAKNSYGTLSAELFAARSQADLIRTHDPGAFRDAWEVERRLARK
jgi:dihydropteroate synthase type 2